MDVHPFIASLPQVNEPKAYGDWIWNSFASVYTNPKTSGLFSYLLSASKDGRGLESPLDCMVLAYREHISAQNQSSFRKGINYNFERCVQAPNEIQADVLSDHIYLTAQVKATEALDGLAKVLLSPVLVTHPHILYESVSTAFQIRSGEPSDSRNEATYNFASRLMDVPMFENEFFLEYLKLMLDSDPGARVQILDKYAQRLTNAATTFSTPEGAPSFNKALDKISRKFPDVNELILAYQIK